MPNTPPGYRIIVVGSTGSGKTHLAADLARRFTRPHVELDALYWGPDWQEAPIEIFRERVSQALDGATWVADGNYSKARDIVWDRADTLIWLDYPLAVIMKRLSWRTLKRIFTQEALWHGNRETFRRSFFTRQSILWWALTTYRRHRRNYTALLAGSTFDHLTIIHLKSPRETAKWLQSLSHLDSNQQDVGSA